MLFLLLSVRIAINIVYSESVFVYLKILFIKIRLYPSRDKKSKSNKSKRNENAEQKKPRTVIKNVNESEDSERGLLESVKLITDILSTFLKAFSKYLHINLARVHIKIATFDAAKTAIMYGAVSGALACLLDTLDSITNLDKIKNSSVNVYTDYLSEKCEADINITLGISVFGALATLFKTLIRYIKQRFNTQIKTERNKQNGKRKQI